MATRDSPEWTSSTIARTTVTVSGSGARHRPVPEGCGAFLYPNGTRPPPYRPVARNFVGAGETSGDSASLLLRSAGQFHGMADCVAVGLRCDHERLTFFGHPEDERLGALSAPLDQLGHVGH
jgi:hypothetical protein